MQEKSNEPIWFDKEPVQTIDLTEQLKGHTLPPQSKYRIMVATPVHSEVGIHYVRSLLKFQMACMTKNILVSFHLIKSSLVQQGRNICAADFVSDKEDYTHMLFIDSDVDFDTKTIFKMLEKDRDIIAAPYPMKFINPNSVYRRMKDEDFKNDKDFLKYGYTFPIKVADVSAIEVTDGETEVTHAPTGCMLIKRNVIEKMIKAYPDLEIVQDTYLNGEKVRRPNFYNFFDCVHDPKTKHFYGEDFGFCKRWTEIGGKIYLYIDDELGHTGEYRYAGRFMDDLVATSKVVDEDEKIK